VKPFKSLAVVSHPCEVVAAVVRDRMSALVPYLDNVQAVDVQDRNQEPDGTLRIVNVWTAASRVPDALADLIRADMLRWTDVATWSPGALACTWTIQPHFHKERVRCSGVTRFESAMAGRGTRLIFEGQLSVDAKGLSPVGSLLDGAMARAVEGFAATLIPNNLRQLGQAATKLLQAEA